MGKGIDLARPDAPQHAAVGGDALVRGAQGAGGDLVPHPDPRLAHVVELQRSGLAVLEVADELAQDPCLVGVGDASDVLLQHSF